MIAEDYKVISSRRSIQKSTQNLEKTQDQEPAGAATVQLCHCSAFEELGGKDNPPFTIPVMPN